jgi:streptogramin lyase
MRTSAVVLLTVMGSVFGLACGGSGASGPVVSVSPATLTVTTGGGATTFAAALSNGAIAPVTWTLTGAGSISATSGLSTSYQPPALGGNGGTATLRATAGCGAGCLAVGDNATITVDAATTGNLTINVILQTSVPATLTVTGPNGFSQMLTSTGTSVLTGLAPGMYTVTAAEIVDTTNAVVDSKYGAPPASVAVAANAAANVTVTYASEPGYGLLWVAGATSDKLNGFAPGDLQVTHAPSVSPLTTGAVQGIAFDGTGTMWASLKSPDSVVSYAASSLLDGATLTAGVTLADGNISDPAGVALGPDGRIWVANCATNSISAYPLAGGPVAVLITSPSGNFFKCPRSIAFDAAGNLWVANSAGVAERFPNAQIAATHSSPTPDVTLTAPTAPASSQPSGIAIDNNGNVWVAFCGGSTVALYEAANGSVSTTAAAVLTPSGVGPVSLDCPVALALDNTFRLWVANKGTGANNGTLSQFALTDMAAGGAATPITGPLTGIGVTVGGLAFNPSPTGLPFGH